MIFDVVIPTIGRPSLHVLLERLASAATPPPGRIFIVDDRKSTGRHFEALPVASIVPSLAERVTLLRGYGHGPAHARNLGWRASSAPWIAFLDDDVLVGPSWAEAVLADLAAIATEPGGARVDASFAKIVVPLPADRRPLDWERNVAALETAHFITADAAFRRSALAAVGGFDERFPRAYREDADLALRLQRNGSTFARGARITTHPVRPASRWISITLQRGNADDAMMVALHGGEWQRRAGADATAYASHAKIVAAALDAARALLERRPRDAARFASAWLAGTALFAARRIAPGPRTRDEVATMLATSVAIPFAAVFHRLRGERIAAALVPPRTKAVLFDRDGTLVHDAPIGGDARRVAAMPHAEHALRRLRDAHVRVGIVTNQPGLARGAFSELQHDGVRRRIDELVGPIETWAVCAHAEDDGCACRKPQPDLVLRAAAAFGARPEECVVVGDIGSDVEAARAAGARSILVPTAVTRPAEIASAPHVAATLERAVDLILCGRV